MKKQQGFTLVELVIVIVILGILAVTAAPKFLDLSSDAKLATVNGVRAALQSANTVIYSKAVLAGEQKKATGSVDANGEAVALVFGYVQASAAEVTKVLDLDGDFKIAQGDGPATATTNVMIYTGATPTADAACMLVYTAAADANSKPTYEIVKTGC